MRGQVLTAAFAGSLALLTTAIAAPANATVVVAGAGAASVPAYTGTSTMAASVALSGTAGGLLGGLVSPIVNNALNPLVADLQGSLSTAVASAIGVSSSLSAATPATQSTPAPGTFPTDLPAGLPSPCTRTSTTKPCYSATSTSLLSLNSVASLTVGALRGYTQQVDAGADATNPIFGRAQIASTSVSVLSAVSSLANPLVSAGTVDSKANCPTTGTPSASVSAASVSLLGGAATVTVTNGAITSVKVGSTSYTLTSLPTTTVAGFTLSTYGTSLKLSTTISAAQLVTALGLSGTDVTNLVSYAVSGTALTLSVIVGANSTSSSSTASAWGLGIGIDLSGALEFNLLGLVGASVTLASGIGGGNYGNVLDARLAYTSCNKSTAGTTTSTAVIPPALI